MESSKDVYESEEFNVSDQIKWKAAHLIWCLVSNHPFVDGNKRTAFQTAIVFLHANGYDLSNIKAPEAVRVLSGVAKNEKSGNPCRLDGKTLNFTKEAMILTVLMAEDIPVDEARRLSAKSFEEYFEILQALADYDKQGVAIKQKAAP